MKKLILFAVLLISSHVHAATMTIDFDSLLGGTIVTDQFAPQGVLIGSSFGDVVVFNGCCSDSGPNSLNGGSFREVAVTFVDPTDPLQPATTDFFRMTLGDIDIPGNGMTAFDIAGNQIAQVLSNCEARFNCPGDSIFETLTLSVAGMHRIVIAAGGQLSSGNVESEATVDTFVFNPVVAQVPEASTLHMLAAGLVLLGLIVLRRSQAIPLAKQDRRH